MAMCDLTTTVFEYKPVWNSGCQSDPDDYVTEKTTELSEKVELEQLKDIMLAVFIKAILISPEVEKIEIETRTVYNKWPDKWGATRTEKKVT